MLPVVSWQPREQKEEEAQLHMLHSYQSGESSELVDEGIDRFQESIGKKNLSSWKP